MISRGAEVGQQVGVQLNPARRLRAFIPFESYRISIASRSTPEEPVLRIHHLRFFWIDTKDEASNFDVSRGPAFTRWDHL